MNRLRRWSALAGLVLLTGLLSALHGQAPPPAEKKADDKPAREMALRPHAGRLAGRRPGPRPQVSALSR